MASRLIPRSQAFIAAAVVALAALVAGCGGSSSALTASAGGTGTTASAAGRTRYPVTITDCGGRATTYATAPSRVVTIDPNITEMLLTLGLKDRIVGFTQFYTPAQEWGPTKAAMDSLPQINSNLGYPSTEAVVATAPDLVTSIYPYAFMDPLPTREGWAKRGVKTYEALGECSGKSVTDLSLLYRDLRNLGVIFDVQDQAKAEIARLQARVAAAQAKAKAAGLASHVIATHDGGKEHPGTYGGTAEAIVALAGSRSAFAGLGVDEVPSWEQFVKADPDVIWVIPDAGPSVAEIEKQLEDDPRTSQVAGVRDRSFVVVPQADATVESPRNVDGLEKMVDALITLKQR